MKKICLSILIILGMVLTLGSYSYAQNVSGKKNCVTIYNSGLQRNNSTIVIDASNQSDQATNLEALHRSGYFSKEVRDEIKQLSFGNTKKITTITYTITDLGKRYRTITQNDLVNDTWKFCK